jgi:putative endonuclease
MEKMDQMAQHNVIIGKWGEGIANRHLVDLGYQIISTNHRTPYGEIDIIASEGTTLVFIEVKTRTSKSLGNPEGSVTPRKQQHILNSAQHYLATLEQPCDDWRVDVVAITGKPGNSRIDIQVFKNALYS